MDNKNRLREDCIEFTILVSDICENISGCSNYKSQLIRSSSSIGANVHEARYAESKLDFIHKFGIAEKEGSETEYWIEILFRKDKLTIEQYKLLLDKLNRIMIRIRSSINTVKAQL